MRRKLTVKMASLALAMVTLGACGQDPSFLNLTGDEPKSPGDSRTSSTDTSGTSGAGGLDGASADATGAGGAGDGGTGSGGVNDPDANGGNGGSGTPGGSGGAPGTSTLPGGTIPVVFPPTVNESDSAALHRCLASWRNAPFNGFTNVRKIYANVVVGGSGSAINDTERTEGPALMLVYAGVNVNSAVNYNFLNPNGYYCIKANVNVGTALTVNLHCNARLADSAIAVNVGSNVNDTTAQIGVHVNSNVTLNTVRPAGDRCVR